MLSKTKQKEYFNIQRLATTGNECVHAIQDAQIEEEDMTKIYKP